MTALLEMYYIRKIFFKKLRKKFLKEEEKAWVAGFSDISFEQERGMI